MQKIFIILLLCQMGTLIATTEETGESLTESPKGFTYNNGPSFTFYLLDNGGVEFGQVEFSGRQYSVLTKAHSKANVSAKANFSRKGGGPISSDHPLVKQAYHNGLKRGFIIGAQF